MEIATSSSSTRTAQLKSAEIGQALGPVIVTHENVSYRVLAPKFQHNGLDVDAHTLRQNPDLVRELVESGSGLLVKVEAGPLGRFPLFHF